MNCVKTLLSHGADPNSKTKSGRTPLHIAAEQGNTKCLQLLMGYNAFIDCEDDTGATPIHLAKIYGNKYCVTFLEMSALLLNKKKARVDAAQRKKEHEN